MNQLLGRPSAEQNVQSGKVASSIFAVAVHKEQTDADNASEAEDEVPDYGGEERTTEARV